MLFPGKVEVNGEAGQGSGAGGGSGGTVLINTLAIQGQGSISANGGPGNETGGGGAGGRIVITVGERYTKSHKFSFFCFHHADRNCLEFIF